MFYQLYLSLSNSCHFFNLFRYLTFRTMGAVLTSLFLSLLLGPSVIRWLKSRQKGGQPIRDDGPESHLLTKKGTPTMGGVLILLSLTVSTFLWGKWDNLYLWLLLFLTLAFGVIGGIDDYLKLKHGHSNNGLSVRLRLGIQFALSLGVILILQRALPTSLAHHIAIPFFKEMVIDAGWLFIPFALCVIVGASNAVNLTDGLDGLAIGPVMIVAGCFCLISYLVGHGIFARYLHLPFIPEVGELAVFCGGLVGAGLGFLWYNAPPAKVFMGDTGSLAIGAGLGGMSLMTKHELVLFIIGGLFVVEAVSVMIQVGFFKLTGGRRVFLMAPIHHHFEKKGWAEPTVVIRFWIIAVVLALLGLSTLKLR